MRGVFLGVSFSVVLSLGPATCRAQFTGLFAFGDSLSDRGNTYNILGGMSDDETVYNLVGYTASAGRYDDGRWSNGMLWIEHLNEQLGLPALQRNDGSSSLASGTDFAYGGSTSGSGHTDLILPNLQTQVSSYVTIAGGAVSATGLHTVWSGGNDVIYYIEDMNPNTPEAIGQFADTMAANISAAVTTLYDAGARHFLVPNLPALGDKPSYVGTFNQAFANDIVNTYNPKLAQTIVDLRNQLPGIQLADWDVYSDFNQLLQDPTNFGFSNVQDAAFSSAGPYDGTVVADPNVHVFWDDTHPTAPGHALLGTFAFEALNDQLIPEPTTLPLLMAGLSTVLCRVKRRRSNGRK